jgi:hypothetical protein
MTNDQAKAFASKATTSDEQADRLRFLRRRGHISARQWRKLSKEMRRPLPSNPIARFLVEGERYIDELRDITARAIDEASVNGPLTEGPWTYVCTHGTFVGTACPDCSARPPGPSVVVAGVDRESGSIDFDSREP